MKKNNKTNNSVNKKTAALVFDRFYGAGTSAAAVILGRILIAAAITFFSISYIFSAYEMPVNKTAMPFIAAGASIVFSLLFTVMRKRIAMPILALIGGVVILSSLNSFWRRFSYFIDALILECDGRLFETTGSTIHPLKFIEMNGRYTYAYIDGVVFGSVILCMLFALITAAGIMGKPHILPSFVSFLLLWVPELSSEKLHFGWQLIPLIALYSGMIAIGSYYRDGLAIRHVYAAGGYRRKVTMDDRRFNAAVRSQNVGQRVVSRGLHYSKYFSSVISTAAVFTALGIILSIVFTDSTGIDYEPLYEKLQSIEGGFGSGGSPFKVGAAADYFTSPSNSVFKANNRLRLTSPSTGTKEIIRVTKPISDKPLYLRGDIGIEFDGASWSSPVTEEPADWRGGLYNDWLPIEVIALADMRDDYFDLGFDGMGMYMDIDVEYLCDTDVIFAPAYDAQYRLFNPKYEWSDENAVKADIFGDFAARRKTDTAAGETLEYLAAVPNYTDASDDLDISYFGAACYIHNKFIVSETYFYDKILTDTNGSFGRGYKQRDYNKYIRYVNDHYLDVPESMKTQLDEFIEGSGLNEERYDIKKKYTSLFSGYGSETNVLIDRFLSAAAVSEYLKSNYTYSLNARVDKRNPVMSFLNNTKSGHCALYASAMTLILREWGIPARYCTGFAANANLSMQTLRSKDLHAWCEVYLDELGWVTFDPTAAAIFDGQGGGTGNSTTESGSVDTSQSGAQSGTGNSTQYITSEIQSGSVSSTTDSHGQDESSSLSSSSAGTQTSNTHDSIAASEPGNSLTFAQILPYLMIMLAICAVIVLIVMIVMAYIRLRKRAYKQVQQFHREKNSDYVYEKLLAVLRFCKLKPMNGEQPHEFFERVEKTLGCTLCDNYELFEKLAFGGSDLDESERAILGRSMDKIYRAAESRFKIVGKIKLRLLVLSKKV